jgi:hypothetical protein
MKGARGDLDGDVLAYDAQPGEALWTAANGTARGPSQDSGA